MFCIKKCERIKEKFSSHYYDVIMLTAAGEKWDERGEKSY